MSVPKLRFKEFEGNWQNSILSKLSIKITDGTHDTPLVRKEGVPFLTAVNVKDGFINYDDIGFVDEITHRKIYDRCNPEKDDLLIVNIGAGTATCARNIVDYQFSLKNVALIKPNKKLLNPIFLEQIQRCKSARLFTSLTSGGAQPFLSLKELGKLSISYPPLQEQTKIASFLFAVDEKISQLTQKHALLTQNKQGMMQKLFSQQIRFKADDGSEFGEWEEKKLGDIASKVGSGSTPRGGAEAYINEGVIFIRSQNVNNDQLLLDDIVYIPIEINEKMAGSKVFANDILLNITGASIGRSCVVPDSFTQANVNQHVCIIRVLNDSPKFIQAFLSSRTGQDLIESYQTGSGREGLNFQSIRSFELDMPCIEEQTKIANLLSSIDQKIEVAAQQIEQAKQWKKGLLQQMLI